MTKVVLNDLANLENQTSAVNIINANNAVIETAFDNTLSRDGTSPNQMNATLDMNSHRILNLPTPVNPTDPLRLRDVDSTNGTALINASTIHATHSGGGTDSGFLVSAANPGYAWNATGQPTDQKVWDAVVIGNTLQFRTVNDANNVAYPWLTVTRGTGTAITGIVVPNINIQPLASSIAQGLQINQTAAGTITGSSPAIYTTANALNYINVTSDTVNIGDGNERTALGIVQKTGGSTVLGMRSGLHVEQWLTAATNVSETQKDILGATFQVYGQHGNSGGNFIGSNSIAYLTSSATGAHGLSGHEIDIVADVGSSVLNKFGLTIIQTNNDTVQGSSTDAGIAFYNAGISGGWKTGLLFNGSTVSAGGVVVDMSSLTLGSPQFLIKGPGTRFYVDGFGNVGGNTLTALAGSPTPIIVGGTTSGTGTFIVPAVLGTRNWTLPTSTGTLVVTASSPLAIDGVTGNLTIALGTGVATFLATPSSANLAAAVTDETGTSVLVFSNNPIINSPTITTPTISGHAVIEGVTSTGATGTGNLVFSTSPTLVTPALGTPASGVATNLTGTAAGLTSGNVTTNANLTGPITSSGNTTSIASQTGTGTKFVVDASPTLTGTPLTPTAAVDTNTTQVASTAFVLAQASSATPLIDGTATVGTSTRFARGDHIHPTDTTRAPLASPTFTGTLTAATIAATTINAFTLGGTISGGGNQVNNIVIGNSTPLAGTFTTLTGTAGSLTGLTGLAIRDTSAAFDLTIAATSSSALSAGRTLTLNMGNVAHTLAFGSTANTITFPSVASDTVAMLGVTQTLTGVNTFTKNAHFQVVGGTGSGFWLDSVTSGADRWFFGSDAAAADSFRIFSALAGTNVLSLAANATANLSATTLQGSLTITGPMVHKNYTVATLPAAASFAYGIVFVTDSTATAITGLGLAPVGGGANIVPVYSDGTGWKII